MPEPHHDSSIARHDARFADTHWSVVLAAGGGDSPAGRAARESLCRAYWHPLYAFARRMGLNPPDAEDAVQGFLAACLEKNYLGAADEGKGRFRSFLLLALKRFLAKEREKALAQKRGGGLRALALDGMEAEERYRLEPAERMSADKLFERGWALALLAQVLHRLRAERVAAGQAESFEALKEFLTGGGEGAPYAAVAARLGMSEGAVKAAVSRLRKRYRELLQEAIADTVGSPEEAEEERRYLVQVLSG